MKTTAEIECQIARLKREIVEVRRENLKLMLMATRYQLECFEERLSRNTGQKNPATKNQGRNFD